MIPYGRQDICRSDIDAVLAVLKSDFLTQGPLVPAFEQAVADYCGVQNAVAMNSATGALHIACLALGVKTGDVVWTSPITFVASANCALYCGATIDFVDIDPKTYNMSVRSLENKLSHVADASQLPKVVIPVHLGGRRAIWRLYMPYPKNMVSMLLRMHRMRSAVDILASVLVIVVTAILQYSAFIQLKLLLLEKVGWR